MTKSHKKKSLRTKSHDMESGQNPTMRKNRQHRQYKSGEKKNCITLSMSLYLKYRHLLLLLHLNPTFMWGRCTMPTSADSPFSLMSSFTLSNHLLLGLPLLLLPCTFITIALLPTQCSSLRITCPYHFNLLSCTFFVISPTFVVPLIL